MNQKTETTEHPKEELEREFSPDFIRVLIALTVATLLVIFLFEHNIVTMSEHWWARGYLYPWVVAGGHTIANGLSEFSGHSPAMITSGERLAALLGILFAFVIGPTLFFFGWYDRRKTRASGATTSSLKGSAVISIVGGILTFAIAIPSIPIAWTQARVSSSLHGAQAIQSNKDQMINDLNMIAYSAYQYRILPHGFNGGEGSFAGYTIPEKLAATEEGAYKAIVTPDAITLNADSRKLPQCTISARINKEGRFDPSEWKYGGDFQ